MYDRGSSETAIHRGYVGTLAREHAANDAVGIILEYGHAPAMWRGDPTDIQGVKCVVCGDLLATVTRSVGGRRAYLDMPLAECRGL